MSQRFKQPASFPADILSDVAERRDQSGQGLERGQRREEEVGDEKQRVFLRGDHIWYQGHERYRGSDASFRLTMAVTWFEREFRGQLHKKRGANAYACKKTANLLLGSGCSRLAARFLQGRRGRKPKTKSETEPKGETPSTKRQGVQPARSPTQLNPRNAELDRLIEMERNVRPESPEAERLTKIIRAQVGAFRRNNPDWEQLFEGWYGAYRWRWHRDAKWYEEQEVHYRRCLESSKQTMDADDPFIAMTLVNLARVCHEQKKYTEAEPNYQEAARIYRSAKLKEDFRELVLDWMSEEIENCRRRKLPNPSPQYRGAYIPPDSGDALTPTR